MSKFRRGLFLDRDGIVNVDTDFAHRPENIIFQPGIFDLVRAGLDEGLVPVIVTNQSGIARGYFSQDAFLALTQWMLEQFDAAGCPIAHVYHCPYLPDAKVEAFRHPDHPWRKPRPGMFHAARDDLGIDLERSVMIGDRWSDAGAADAAGIGIIALVGSRADSEASPVPPIAVDRLDDVSACRDWLLKRLAKSQDGLSPTR